MTDKRIVHDLSPPLFGRDDVMILKREVLSADYGRLERFTLVHRLYGGGWSEPMSRELYDSGDAVTVLPFDPRSGNVALVEQFRLSAFAHGSTPWLVETIAGRISGEEKPCDAARREALEEAGLDLHDLISIGAVYAAPGIFNEYVYLFCARADLSSTCGVHGLKQEHEDIRVIVVPLDEALAALGNGRICDATTTICLQWLALNRDMLLERWREER
jgi:ADP-ribose pyrophosphatase